MKSYEQRTKSILKKTDILKAQIKKKQRNACYVSLAAISSAAIIFTALQNTDKLLPTDTLEADNPTVVETNSNDNIAQATQTPTQSNQRLVIDGPHVNYSELEFNYDGDASYIYMVDQTQAMCLAYSFRQSLLSECDLIVKATIQNVEYGEWDCPVPDEPNVRTLIYTLMLDRVFYSNLDVSEEQTFIIEQAVFGGSLSDLEFGLKVGGQYLLPLAKQERGFSTSEYGLVYAFEPMIECTANGAYIFSNRWPSLFNEHTAKINIDIPMTNPLMNTTKDMFVRADDEFENDFQLLADYYCSNDYQQEQRDANSYTGSSAVDAIVDRNIPEQLWVTSISEELNYSKDEAFVRVSFINSSDQMFVKVSGETCEVYYGKEEDYREFYFSESLSFYMAKGEGRTEYSIYPIQDNVDYISKQQAIKAGLNVLKNEGILLESNNCIVAQPSVFYETVEEYNDKVTPCWYLCFKANMSNEENPRIFWIVINAQTGEFICYRL